MTSIYYSMDFYLSYLSLSFTSICRCYSNQNEISYTFVFANLVFLICLICIHFNDFIHLSNKYMYRILTESAWFNFPAKCRFNLTNYVILFCEITCHATHKSTQWSSHFRYVNMQHKEQPFVFVQRYETDKIQIESYPYALKQRVYIH